ncbi:protein YgiW [Spirochaetia bacterium]|nr:protein YgiW [Spirochaetia bacterium]
MKHTKISGGEMKKTLIVVALFVAFSSGCVLFAQQGGGYNGPGLAVITVAEARNLSDDSPVKLRGNIVQFLGDKKYLFQDSSGTITVEISPKIWGGLTVDQNDVVEITGEIDKNFRKIEVEVKSIKK